MTAPFEPLRTLKTGGMGEVLLARRRGPGGFEQLLAIKTIRADLAGSPAVREMFLDEARLLARLAHPAIATVLDFGEDGGALYLAMEYVRGIRFRELADRRPPPAIAARAIAEACRGLHAAHELADLGGNPLGVVHRDLSPENLMLGFDGQVKVIDFGIALGRGRTTVTEHGTIKGKPPYMSPEQVRGDALDRRSDVFSIALVLHELLTGAPVFAGDNLYAVARAVIEATIAPPGSPLPGLDDAVMRALAKARDARTPTAAALADELERIAAAAGGESLEAWATRALADDREAHRAWLAEVVEGEGGGARVGRPSGVVTAAIVEPPAVVPPADEDEDADEDETPPSRRGPVVAVIAIALLLAAALAVYLLTRPPPPPPPVVVAVVADAGPRDAAPSPAREAAPPADAAAPPADAAPRRRPPVHPGPVDAAPRPIRPPPPAPPIDAAPPAAAAPGSLTITATPFALVRVDGADWGTTPIYKRRLAAGAHQVDLLSPDSGELRLHRTVDVRAGQLSRIDL